MSSNGLQFQIDVINGSTIGAKVVHRLLKDCTEDDLQGFVFPPLELFGQWLMVAGERIRQGEEALRVQPPTWLRIPLRILKPSIIKSVANSMYLTSSFLFVSCCTTGFDTQKAGELIHEMMRLKGHLNNYPISSELVCNFAEIMNGCRDFIPGKTPFDIYDTISKGAWSENIRQRLKIDNLYNGYDTKELAKLIVRILDALQDVTCNRQIYLEGSRTGIWMASIFAWLRPDETEIFVKNSRIYPTSEAPRQGSEPRLLVSFRESRDSLDDVWKMSEWKDINSPADTFHIGGNDMSIPKQHFSLWRNTRYQLETRENSLVSHDISHLATALVNIVAENGILWSEDERVPLKLTDICSENFLSIYPEIMVKFGWGDLNNTRTEWMADAIQSQLHKQNFGVAQRSHVEILGKLIEGCYDDFNELHNEPMLLSINRHTTRDLEIIEHAINLAGQALMSSLWSQLPKHTTYWPLEQGLLNEYAKILTELLGIRIGSNPEQPETTLKCTFWKLRQHSILSAIPTADVSPADLACAGGGYVLYSSVLSIENENMTDRRMAACVQVRPGCLRWEGIQGRYLRLAEEDVDLKLASRLINTQQSVVKLFNETGEFIGISESNSQNKLDISIISSIRCDYFKKTLYLRTHLKENLPPGSLVPNHSIPTRWRQSVESILFATHVNTNSSRMQQLKLLVEQWNGRGQLGGTFQWCLIGRLPSPGLRYITTTRLNSELRFFEAGNLSENHKVIIRQGHVPLLHCVKIAMETYGDDSEWVVIA